MITHGHKATVDAYCKGVLDGSVIAGELVKLMVRRYLKDLETAGERGYYFDESAAEFAANFIPFCRHSRGKFAGQPLQLEPWQLFVVWQLYGWRREVDGTRRFRKALIEVARKNGKSTFAAALGLMHLVADRPVEQGPEVYCVATKQDQAKIIFSEAKAMVSQAATLRKRLKPMALEIQYEALNGKFRPLGSDSNTNDGWNPSCTIVDELHAWTEGAHRGLWERINTAGGAREQPLTIIVTTAGSDASTIWREEREYAARVLEQGVTDEPLNDTFLPAIYCIDTEDDPLDAASWPKANPNYGVSVKPDYLKEQAEEAKGNPSRYSQFRRFHANVLTASSERAVAPGIWPRAYDGDYTPPAGAKCWGGLDLGRSNDFSGFALIFQDEDLYHLRTWQWTCEDRQQELRTADVGSWIHDGYLIEHPDDAVDFGEIERFIAEQCDKYNVQSICYDRQFARELSQRLADDRGINVVEFQQTPRSYNEPTRAFIHRLGTMKRQPVLYHDGNPCLAWQAANVQVKRNSRDEWMPDKGGESWQKIDSMVAAIMALSEAMFAEADPVFYFSNNDLEAV